MRIGPFELSVKEKEPVNIPVWAEVGAVVVGGASLFVRSKRAPCTAPHEAMLPNHDGPWTGKET